ncbi:methylthioribulose 1-phosphate dehydratase [Pseudohongiella nitratireducens]|uniref:methylthioribulose 1-phosphate dehydratase n=1 Tax=Pseudohongiella nitratireducens TaxID=1768907 RepID=UPI0024091635|nr:methylthioribulose 1-phosphate dehydratase [Pseudohongiella nitratireducens]MDF1622481.1 methylthioribulose 1-phosphate dehydratase [Pseudohongiella nitratireducens]|tara:strand:- start:1676 stop:2329 length:654 start_codon:yes stop_codon:yes gene_type:complete
MNDAHSFEQARRSIIAVGQRIWRQGWCPATSSNFSQRLDDERCAITVSGRDKGALQDTDIMQVDMQGRSLDGQKPSAETLLHTQLYRRDQSIGAVLHTHSVKATLVSMHTDGPVSWQGLELLKAFQGTDSHEGNLTIPVFDNTQDIAALADQVQGWMSVHGTGVAYLIRGHGLYTWGRDMTETLRHLEALEFLLDYYWQTHRLASAGERLMAGDAKA